MNFLGTFRKPSQGHQENELQMPMVTVILVNKEQCPDRGGCHGVGCMINPDAVHFQHIRSQSQLVFVYMRHCSEETSEKQIQKIITLRMDGRWCK